MREIRPYGSAGGYGEIRIPTATTSSPCEAWHGFDFYRFQAAYPDVAGPTSAGTRLYRIAFAKASG
jgi:hypothetical protein